MKLKFDCHIVNWNTGIERTPLQCSRSNSTLFHVLIGILKCSGVDRNSLVEQLLQSAPLSFGLVGAGPGEVLLQVLDKFRMDTYRVCDGGHDVLREGPGLISADGSSICHSLARAENTDQEFLISHSPGCKRQGQGYGQRET